MQFIDKCELYIKAGDGGNGVVAWRKEAHYPEGGPWGGDGGNGGDVILIADHNYNSLFHLRYLKHAFGEDGGKGETKMCHGKNGQHVYIKVPLGTSIYDKDGKLITDLIFDNQTHIIANGGKGGHGNAYFKSSYNRVPSLYENGDLGEELTVTLKLKYIADIGLVGLPNAGKSSLITAISNARPKIADYPFTTLSPVLGSIKLKHRDIVMADIPGLIEDASQNKGLGFEFLKHIERCHLLIHVISLDKNDHEDIGSSFDIICNELEKYNAKLIDKKTLIVANKNDTEDAKKQLTKLKYHLKNKKIDAEIIDISAKEKNNINEFLETITKIDEEIFSKSKISYDSLEIIEIKKEKEIDKSITIVKDELDRWSIKCPYLEYWLHKIPLNTKDNMVRFNQKMQTVDLENKVKQFGGKRKDTMVINNVEFEMD